MDDLIDFILELVPNILEPFITALFEKNNAEKKEKKEKKKQTKQKKPENQLYVENPTYEDIKEGMWNNEE